MSIAIWGHYTPEAAEALRGEAREILNRTPVLLIPEWDQEDVTLDHSPGEPPPCPKAGMEWPVEGLAIHIAPGGAPTLRRRFQGVRPYFYGADARLPIPPVAHMATELERVSMGEAVGWAADCDDGPARAWLAPIWGLPVETVVVTRHQGLIDHLISIGLCTENTPVLPHAGEDDVRGRHVVGVLPIHLAALAARVTVIPLDLPAELRGIELDRKQVATHAGPPQSYTVMSLDPPEMVLR